MHHLRRGRGGLSGGGEIPLHGGYDHVAGLNASLASVLEVDLSGVPTVGQPPGRIEYVSLSMRSQDGTDLLGLVGRPRGCLPCLGPTGYQWRPPGFSTSGCCQGWSLGGSFE